MKNLYDFLEEKERLKIRYWKELSPSKKHFALMYVYRLKTDFENINDYVETYRFIKSGLSVDDLPEYISRLSPIELRKEAYEEIGKLNNLPKDLA